LRTYPDLSANCIQEGLDLPLRLWYLLRQAAPMGRLPLGEVFALSCGNRRQTRSWLRKGNGLFWTVADGRLWLAGLGKVCERLGIPPRLAPAEVPLDAIQNLQLFRAALFASWFGRPCIISQKRLGELFGRAPKTLYSWGQIAQEHGWLEVTHNVAQASLPDDDTIDRYPSGVLRAMGIDDIEEESSRTNFVWSSNGKLYWKLPNRYASTLERGPVTTLQKRAEKAARQAPGSGAGANGAFRKMFFTLEDDVRDAHRALQQYGLVFTEMRRRRYDARLWFFNII